MYSVLIIYHLNNSTKRIFFSRHLKNQDEGQTLQQIEKLMSEMLTLDDDSFDGLSSEDNISDKEV